MKPRVLVVDSDRSRRESAEATLKKEGCVVTVATGAEAIDLMGRSVFDFIVCDLEMLGPSGGELLRSLTQIQAEKEKRVQTRFLTKMTHELRTPLNAIIGFSELLIQELYGPLNPRQKTYVQNVIASGRGLLGRINSILDGSEAGS